MKTIRIGEKDSIKGPRIGGESPKSVSVPPGYFYFCTIPYEEEFLSIFYINDFNKMWRDREKYVKSGGSVIILKHKDCGRGGGVFSDLSAHELVIAEGHEQNTEEEIWRFHKLGGFWLGTFLDQDLPEGYTFIAQIDFPNADDATVSGNWPFMDCLFSMFEYKGNFIGHWTRT